MKTNFNYDLQELFEVDLLSEIYNKLISFIGEGYINNEGFNMYLKDKYGRIEEKKFCVSNVDILRFIRDNTLMIKYNYLVDITYNCDTKEFDIILLETIK